VSDCMSCVIEGFNIKELFVYMLMSNFRVTFGK